MRDLGYELDDRLESEAFYLRHHFHLVYRNAGLPWCCFELHWDVASATMDTRFDVAAMAAAARPADLDGRRVLIPAPDDFLLHTALHATINGFNYLGQLRDVHLLLERYDAELPAPALWRKADRYRIVAPLAAALALAPLFGPSPAAARLLAQRPPHRRAPLMRALTRPPALLRQRTLRSTAGSIALSLLRRDRLRERLAFVARRFRPTPDMLAERHDIHVDQRAHSGQASLWQGFWDIAAAAAYILLTVAGLEVEPRPAPAPARHPDGS
jgi:hypothetical protein